MASRVTFCISIGCYRLCEFIELNIKRCRVLFGGDVPILLSDDLSAESPKIKALAEKYDCAYLCGEARRSHFSGDMQACVNALVFAREQNCDVALKISQRFIPVLPAFRECLERSFENPAIQVAIPGRPAVNQIARPQARFYNQFGILTDVVAMRNGAISPEELVEVYRNRFTTGATPADSLVETTWGWLLENKFKYSHVVLPELANHEPFKPKIYLRKSQALEHEYRMVAEMDGVEGTWNILEWGAIEKQDYFCRPNRV